MQIQISVYAFAFLLAGFLAKPASAQVAVPKPSAEDYDWEFGAVSWKPSPDLTIRTGPGGTDVDLIGTFGIEDKSFTDFRLVLKPVRKHKIRIQYLSITYAKDAVLNRTFTFAGNTYTVDAPASASLDWTLWQFGYEWDFVSNDYGFVGVIGEIKYNEVRASLSSAALNVSSQMDTEAPIPAVGGIVRGYLVVPRRVSVTVEVTGIKVPDRFTFNRRLVEFHDSLADFDVYGMVNLSPHLGVRAGYHSLDVRYLVNDDAGTLKMKGPYIGASVRF